MLLQRGVSGYCSPTESALPSTDFNEFKGLCHLVGAQYGGKVLGFRPAYRSGLTNNYHLAWLGHKYDNTRVIIVFLNAHYPLVALATAENHTFDATWPAYGSWQPSHQVFEPVIIALLSTTYQILEPQELQEPLSFRLDHKTGKAVLENSHELGQDEVAMIYKWYKTLTKPITVGEVVFNHWD